MSPGLERPRTDALDPGDALPDRFGCLVQVCDLADHGQGLHALQGPPAAIWLSFDRVHGLFQQTLPFPGALELHIQPTASADETRQCECGTYRLRGGFGWGPLLGTAGPGVYRRRAPVRSLSQCWRRSPDLLQAWPGGMPPSWVAAVAVAQEHGALFFFGLAPVQGRSKMLLMQKSEMAPRQMSRKLWDIWIPLRPDGGERAQVSAR